MPNYNRRDNLQLILGNQYPYRIGWRWGKQLSLGKLTINLDRPTFIKSDYDGRCSTPGCYEVGEKYWSENDYSKIYCLECAYSLSYCDRCFCTVCQCPDYYDPDDYYDVMHEEEDYFYFEPDVLEQASSIEDKIYHGKILTAEILKQQDKMFVLATTNMLIADIDCGDDIAAPLALLEDYVATSGGSFRVYKTKNGLRYLQTDIAYQNANRSAIALLKELGSDPEYVNLCNAGKRFMARLTPKITPVQAIKYYEEQQWQGAPSAVTRYLKTVGKDEIAPMLEEIVQLHDLITGALKQDLPLF